MEAAEWREWHKTSDGAEICAPSIPILPSFLPFGSLVASFLLLRPRALSSTLFSSIPFERLTSPESLAESACLSNFQSLKKESAEEVSFLRWRFTITSGFSLDAFPDWHSRFKCTNMKLWNYLSIRGNFINSHFELIYWSQKRLT